MSVYVKVADHTKRNEILAALRKHGAKIDDLRRRYKDASPLTDGRRIEQQIGDLREKMNVLRRHLRAADAEIERQTKANVASARAKKRYIAGRLQ